MHKLLRWIDDRWQAKAAVAGKYQPMVPFKKKWGVLALALVAIGLTVVLFTVASPILERVYQALLGPFITEDWANANTGVTVAIMFGVLFALSLVLAFAIVLLRNKLVLPKQHAWAEQVNRQRDASNSAVRAEEQQIDAQLQQAGHDFAQNIGTGFFPEAYRYEDAVVFCIQAVQNHRADSVGQAINLYESELSRRRVEDMQAEQLAEAQRARKLQAVGNVINATMQGAAIGTMRAEGQANRAAGAANTARITEELKKPQTVYLKKRGGLW